MIPLHKAFTIGFAENGLVLIQHSLDDEELSQTRIEPSCEKLIETLGNRIRGHYEMYREWCEFYELNDPYEGDGFKQFAMMPNCLKGVMLTKDIEKSESQFEAAKVAGVVDGPEVVFKSSKPSGAKIYIRKKR